MSNKHVTHFLAVFEICDHLYTFSKLKLKIKHNAKNAFFLILTISSLSNHFHLGLNVGELSQVRGAKVHSSSQIDGMHASFSFKVVVCW